ncbi:MAG: large conductance mechanosensitive channel protein MscL [Candidatus Palauibacterales bacterium]|nr:large conductance mechanosensitive channel protein MscL [Candidatus Palauibacterales bacterium]MDP2481998.1 large conductance mechanosensitive channel protein MscL [Candidatus Palauibacterales bacterium]
MCMLKEFKEFAAKGNMLDMAVGIVIGAAFATIISSLVNDIIMPPIGMALGGVDFSEFYVLLQAGAPAGPYATLAAAKEAGAVTLNWGIFVNALISFLIVAFALFLVVKGFNKMKAEQAAEEAAPEAPPEPSPEVTLLTEIRDLLKSRA